MEEAGEAVMATEGGLCRHWGWRMAGVRWAVFSSVSGGECSVAGHVEAGERRGEGGKGDCVRVFWKQDDM